MLLADRVVVGSGHVFLTEKQVPRFARHFWRHVVSPSKESMRRAPRRPGGRPRLNPEKRRTRRVSVDMTEREYSELKRQAALYKVSIPSLIRSACENGIVMIPDPYYRHPPLPDILKLPETWINVASSYKIIADDLARIADAASSGIVIGIEPDLLNKLHDIAHEVGMQYIGISERVR
ncbi:hypothetical protein [Methylobacterium currus]|uniref:hypothetical protein n=1 Tax=Methylobacterium currus TaxID=2051553 RepID=UPI000F4ED9D1|nr:hypothetical protein [Methylobacterium currus]